MEWQGGPMKLEPNNAFDETQKAFRFQWKPLTASIRDQNLDQLSLILENGKIAAHH